MATDWTLDQTPRAKYTQPHHPAAPMVFQDGSFTGVTAREWWAAQALQGLMSREKIWYPGMDRSVDPACWPDHVAHVCFKVADAMIAESKKGQ